MRLLAKPHGAHVRRAVLAAVPAVLIATAATAQNDSKPKPAADRGPDGEIARYCGAIGPSAAEARAAYQLRRLADLEREVREEVEKLEAKEQAARDWVTRRESMMKQATDDVVSIYSKMAPDAAAAQMAEMDDGMAAAVLAKLKPQAAGAILAEMPPEKAAKLSSLVAGSPGAEKS